MFVCLTKNISTETIKVFRMVYLNCAIPQFQNFSPGAAYVQEAGTRLFRIKKVRWLFCKSKRFEGFKCELEQAPIREKGINN